MNVNLLITKDYIKNHDFAVRKNKPKTNPISSKAKMSSNPFSQKDYENKTAFRPQKNKPKQTQFKPCPERSRMGQFLAPLFRVLYTLRGPVLRPLFPDEAVFSFDLLARPVILNANIRQLHRPMKSEQIEPFKARKETYHVH